MNKELLSLEEQEIVKNFVTEKVLQILRDQLEEIIEIRMFGSIIRKEFGHIPKGKKTSTGVRYWSDIDFVIITTDSFKINDYWKHKFTTKEKYWSAYELKEDLSIGVIFNDEPIKLKVPVGAALIYESLLYDAKKRKQIIKDGVAISSDSEYEIIFRNKDFELKNVIEKASKHIINNIKKEAYSLYLGGSIITADKKEDSDIDFFGIVKKYDEDKENELNEFFKEYSFLFGKKDIKYRSIPLKSLVEGEEVGVIKFFHPRRFVQRIPFFKLLWGDKIHERKDLLKPLSLDEEKKFLKKQLERSIKDIKKGKEKFPLEDFSKHVMNLVMVEAQEKGYGFEPRYNSLAKYFEDDKHIIHKALNIRYDKDLNRKKVLRFCKEAKKYMKKL